MIDEPAALDLVDKRVERSDNRSEARRWFEGDHRHRNPWAQSCFRGRAAPANVRMQYHHTDRASSNADLLHSFTDHPKALLKHISILLCNTHLVQPADHRPGRRPQSLDELLYCAVPHNFFILGFHPQQLPGSIEE